MGRPATPPEPPVIDDALAEFTPVKVWEMVRYFSLPRSLKHPQARLRWDIDPEWSSECDRLARLDLSDEERIAAMHKWAHEHGVAEVTQERLVELAAAYLRWEARLATEHKKTK